MAHALELNSLQSGDLARPDNHVAPAGSSDLEGIDWCSVPPGTNVIVETRNSRYRLTKVGGKARNALIRGGAIRATTMARIEGATAGGSLLKLGWILKDLLIEITLGDRTIVTSPVQSISIEN